MMPGEVRVLIAGVGIAGLALARALARSRVSVELIEREPAWRRAGTGVYLPGNTARALRTLGLERQVAARAVEIERQRFCDHRGRLLFDVDVRELWAGVGPCLALHRADLHQALLDGTADVPIRLGCGIDSLAERNGAVAVELSDGSGGEYDLVVGADGIRSAVRRLMFGTAPRTLGQTGWRFLAPRPPELEGWSVMLGRRAAFLTLPIADDWVYCYGDVLAREPAESLVLSLSRFDGLAQQLVAGAADVHVSTIEEVALDRWVRGRVVLIGDAAHATSPNMAQGVAMALEDALVLADCVRSQRSIPDVLAAFVARRRPRTDWVRAQTHRRDRTRYLAAPLRDSVLRLAGQRIFRANYRPLLADP